MPIIPLTSAGSAPGSLWYDTDSRTIQQLVTINPSTWQTFTSGGGGDVTSDQITDSSAVGRSILTAADVAAILTVLGLTAVPQTAKVQLITDPLVDLETGNGQIGPFIIPVSMNGWVINKVTTGLATAGVTGSTTIQVRRLRSGVSADMCSTRPVIDSTEVSSLTGTVAVIDTDNDDVATDDHVFIDIDAVQTGTAPKGLSVMLEFTAVA